MKKSGEDARSSQIFFTARVKNKREDTKLAYQLKQLERQLGHTFFDIHKEIRDLKNELKATKRSSGRSSDEWFSIGDSGDGGLAAPKPRLRSIKSAGGEHSKPSSGPHEVRRKKLRISSAPADESVRRPTDMFQTTREPERLDQADSTELTVDKGTGGTLKQGKCERIKKYGVLPAATRTSRPGQPSGEPNIYLNKNVLETVTERSEKEVENRANDHRDDTVNDHNPDTLNNHEHETHSHQKKLFTKRNNVRKLPKGHSTLKQSRSTADRLPINNSIAGVNQGTVVTTGNFQNVVERPLSAQMNDAVKERWLKPALKSRSRLGEEVVRRPKKTVRIATDYPPNDSQTMSAVVPKASRSGPTRTNSVAKNPRSRPQNKVTVSSSTFLTEPSGSTLPESATQSTTPKSEGSNSMRPKSPNVVPDVRKKVLSGEELEMKKKRDSLLACSVAVLLTGNPLGKLKPGNETVSERDEGIQNERRASVSSNASDDGGRASPSPRRPSLRRRFSFRSISMLAMSQQNGMTIEKKSTLGSRLKIKTPAEESITRRIDIKKSVQVQDSDSDEECVTTIPAKPVIDLKNVKSKISNQWKADAAVLDKPPTLNSDISQLQKSLAASHLTRERDLKAMQEENGVDPLKAIDDDRQSALLAKLSAFNRLLDAGQKQDKRRKSVIEAIHSGADGQQILKLFRHLDKQQE